MLDCHRAQDRPRKRRFEAEANIFLHDEIGTLECWDQLIINEDKSRLRIIDAGPHNLLAIQVARHQLLEFRLQLLPVLRLI